jgi:ABC-type lipoprotein release transport system permease subunit
VHLNATAVLAKDTELLTTDLILVAPAMFQRLFGEGPDRATDLAVTIRNRNEASTIAHKILQALPGYPPILREEIIHTYDALFDWRSGYVIVLLGGAGLAFLIFALDRATGLSAEEKREVAILKAVGWDTGDILQLKFWEGIVISLTAYLVGVILAYWHVFLLPAPLFEHALKGWAILYPHFQLQPVVSLYQLAVVLAFTVLPYTLITIVPSWRVAVTDPDTVMRQG